MICKRRLSQIVAVLLLLYRLIITKIPKNILVTRDTNEDLYRLFASETGMQFGVWRQQMRLMASLKYLANVTPVIRTSQNVGYKSVAAFSSAFKRTFGIPPNKYFID